MDNAISVDGLGAIDGEVKQLVGRNLWSWDLCGRCTGRLSCNHTACPWSRNPRLDTFWDLYTRMTDAYSPEILGRTAAIRSHADIVNIMQAILTSRTTTRVDLLRIIFEDGRLNGEKPPTLADQNRAFNIGASIVLLMDFGIWHDEANTSATSNSLVSWRSDTSVDCFIEEAFPRIPTESDTPEIISRLKVSKLMKHAKLVPRATNDIRRHLLLDKKNRTVWVFHQSTAVRELLLASADDPTATLLPRDLMIEVLDTIRYVLFPWDDKSQKLLKSLVLRHGWDKGLLSDLSTPYRSKDDPEPSYAYFSDRLRELHEEVSSPTPHGWLERRLQRKNETYMLKATMYGVFIAVTLGFLGLGVAIFQAWVGYQQWKHPVKDS
ncbi:hypothetical protein FB567DRAFT_579712 [Paraphoma chrysanthemicola]|uniref:Uncharacterized protein n=1 Tax=Paraphoma chrysanthemicola TaxID=798071 RepID=A0A8K0R8Q6_9PLEO|nr:hypothetical protein FB567DRAFT_579712 [Paraphoma chrysanthemicola]